MASPSPSAAASLHHASARLSWAISSAINSASFPGPPSDRRLQSKDAPAPLALAKARSAAATLAPARLCTTARQKKGLEHQSSHEWAFAPHRCILHPLFAKLASQ